MIRTTEKTVIFWRPFFISGFDEPFPAGDYLVETDEELVEGLSFRAYRRILTVMQLPALPGRPGLTHSLTIDPHELDEALKRDRELAKKPDDKDRIPASAPRLLESCGETADRHALKRSEARARNRAISSGAASGFLGLPMFRRSAG